MRAIICGGRNYWDWDKFCDVMNEHPSISTVITGGANGADAMAVRWAKEQSINCEVYKANWSVYGKAAGGIRNFAMIRDGKPDIVIAFPGGRGTANMIRQAESFRIKVYTAK